MNISSSGGCASTYLINELVHRGVNINPNDLNTTFTLKHPKSPLVDSIYLFCDPRKSIFSHYRRWPSKVENSFNFWKDEWNDIPSSYKHYVENFERDLSGIPDQFHNFVNSKHRIYFLNVEEDDFRDLLCKFYKINSIPFDKFRFNKHEGSRLSIEREANNEKFNKYYDELYEFMKSYHGKFND